MTLLICDDDLAILNAIEIYMKTEGHKVYKATNGIDAIEVARTETLHLIIMDIMMPKMDGITAVANIREFSNVPILFLSAKSEDTDRILGLNMGADDYLTKPFNPMELIARCRSLLRRYTQLGSIDLEPQVIKNGDMVIDDTAKNVYIQGEIVKLTPSEYKIVKFLGENAGKVFSISQIYETVWQEPAYNAENTVSVHIRRIREKIEINPKNPKYLKVVWGIGYKIEKVN